MLMECSGKPRGFRRLERDNFLISQLEVFARNSTSNSHKWRP